MPNEDGKSLLDKILINVVGFERQYAGSRKTKTTMVIVDSKTIYIILILLLKKVMMAGKIIRK